MMSYFETFSGTCKVAHFGMNTKFKHTTILIWYEFYLLLTFVDHEYNLISMNIGLFVIRIYVFH